MVISKPCMVKLKEELKAYKLKKDAWDLKDSLDKKLKRLKKLVDESTKRKKQISVKLKEGDLAQDLIQINEKLEGLSERIKLATKERSVVMLKARKLNNIHRKIEAEVLPFHNEIAGLLKLKLGLLNDFSVRIDQENNVHVHYCKIKRNNDIERYHITLYLNGETRSERLYSEFERELHGWCDHNLGFNAPSHRYN